GTGEQVGRDVADLARPRTDLPVLRDDDGVVVQGRVEGLAGTRGWRQGRRGRRANGRLDRRGARGNGFTRAGRRSWCGGRGLRGWVLRGCAATEATGRHERHEPDER